MAILPFLDSRNSEITIHYLWSSHETGLCICRLIGNRRFALGCNGSTATTHQGLLDQMMGSMDQMVNILSGITDEASANAAKPKMEALAKTIKDIKEKGKALGDPPPDIKAKLDKQLEEKQKELQAKMVTFMVNAAKDPKIIRVLEPIMRDFGKAIAE